MVGEKGVLKAVGLVVHSVSRMVDCLGMMLAGSMASLKAACLDILSAVKKAE